jgi:hypothetical protein
MYEPHHAPLLPRRLFLRRLGRHSLIAGALFVVSIAAGIAGFHWLASESWLDAYLDATMLLGGMGPVGKYDCADGCVQGKIFAGLYALYSGVVFLGGSALVLAPVLHRIMHKLHVDEQESSR